MVSQYLETFFADDKKHYEEKFALKNGVKQEDPYPMEDGWSDGIRKLLNLSWSEITKFLIETPSLYTIGARKDFKSLEGYDFFREGHVQDCFYHDIPASVFLFYQIKR